ncbi:MAG TPA: hypothetical protein VK629_16280, partial [Steroidobacteraceae bacterium]|nr:hypothetical protein [Steroidobacteraceae bacterium]
MNLISSLSLNKKLIVAMFILWIPSVVQLTQTIVEQTSAIDTIELELAGIRYAHGLSTVIGSLADHRGVADLYINGDQSRAQAITAAASAVDAAIADVTKLEQSTDSRLRNEAEWKKIQDEWQSLRKDVLTLPAQVSERLHVAIIDQLRALHARSVDRSRLLLSPEEASYYLTSTALMQVPRVEMDVFALRGALSAVGDLKQLPAAVRSDLAAKSARVAEN